MKFLIVLIALIGLTNTCFPKFASKCSKQICDNEYCETLVTEKCSENQVCMVN